MENAETNEILVVNREGQVLEMETGEDELIISVSLSEDGYLAVTAEKKNYKGCVSVYDLTGELLFAFNSSQRFVVDACSFAGGQKLAAVTLGQENSVFVSNVVLYELDQEEPYADYDVTDGLVTALGEQDGSILTVSDTCFTAAARSGEVEAVYAYNGAYLREYALEGDGFAALLLNRYKSGSVGTLVTVDDQGEEIASLEVRDEILGISAAGRYLGVLYLDRLVIYNQELQEYATLNGISYAKSVLMRQDGTALLAGTQEAELFLP